MTTASNPEPPLARVPSGSTWSWTWATGAACHLPPRDEHHAELGRILLVLAAIPRPGQPRAVRRPRGRAVLDGAPATAVVGAPAGAGDPGGVDLYIGGVEHAVLHLLYARFWHKVLFDLGHVTSEEPFRRCFSQGYIQAHAYRDDRGQPVQAAEVVEQPGHDGGETTFTWRGQPVSREFGKIGKSLKNVVSPDEMFEAYGADTLRVYEMSMGPLELQQAVGDPGRRRCAALPATVVAQRDRRGDRCRPGARRTHGPGHDPVGAQDDRRVSRGLCLAAVSIPRSPG